jgi:arsenate reductase-like glutaredoxin family protein
MITSDSEDLQKISSTLDVLQSLLIDNIEFDLDGKPITREDIQRLFDYYKKIHSILTTAGMSLKDYNEAISYISD